MIDAITAILQPSLDQIVGKERTEVSNMSIIIDSWSTTEEIMKETINNIIYMKGSEG